MKIWLVPSLCFLFLLLAYSSAQATEVLSPSLKVELEASGPGELIPINVVLKKQADPVELESMVVGKSKQERREIVVSLLKRLAEEEQSGLLSFLKAMEAEGKAESIRSLWGINALCLSAVPQVIRAIANYPEVRYADYDQERYMLLYPAEPPRALAMPDVTSAGKEIVWNVQRINADQVWPQGYRGQWIVVAVIDTGVNYSHGDLADHLWTDPNYPNHGWDFRNNDNDPRDDNGHGSHCAGTVSSDATNGSNCGVAPDAQIMALKVLSASGSGTESDVWNAIQFAISPPLSPSNGADVMSLSLGWQHQWFPARATWRDYCNNALAAGVVMAVAGGNERGMNFPPDAIRTPGDVPPPWRNPDQQSGGMSAVVTVGATDIGANDPYASFSSPGPVTWETVPPFNDYPYPPGLIDPDVCAPGAAGGAGIKSIRYDNNTGYTQTIGGWPAEGTSMATPHCAGAAALVLSKNPTLLPAVVDSILEVTAVDRGPAGKDNDYGAGRIDALAAVNLVQGAPQAGIVYVSHRIDDAGQAWPDSTLQPGETVNLIASLANDSSISFSNVVGILRENSPWITLVDSFAVYPDMNPGDTVDNSLMPYRLSADPSTPQGIDIPCSLLIRAQPVYQVLRGFLLEIGYLPGLNELANGQLPMTDFQLSQNHPNPFFKETQVAYSVWPMAETGDAISHKPLAISLRVYDLSGRLVRTLVDGEQGPGSYSVLWDGKDSSGRELSAGFYFYRLSATRQGGSASGGGAGEFTAVRKLLMLD